MRTIGIIMGIVLVAILMIAPATAFEFDKGVEDRFAYEAQAVPILWEFRDAGIGAVLYINGVPMNYNEFKAFYYEDHPDERYNGPYISMQVNPRPMPVPVVDEPPVDDGNGNGNGDGNGDDECKPPVFPPRPPNFPPWLPWPPGKC